jgi:hypothetical protein
MRRVLAILKYVPAVLCGLLAVAWVVSLFHLCGVEVYRGKNEVKLFLDDGTLVCDYNNVGVDYWHIGLINQRTRRKTVVGVADYAPWGHITEAWVYGMRASVPLPLVLTLLFPFARGSFTRFRFPLWSYFAWTALVAAELAYYLR